MAYRIAAAMFQEDLAKEWCDIADEGEYK